MRMIQLDYIAPRPSRLSFLLLVSALLLAAYAAWFYFDALKVRNEVLARYRTANMPALTVTQSLPESTVASTQLVEINKAVAMLTVPWDALFAAIERTPSDNVVLLAVEPTVSRKQMILSAEARTLKDMLNYVKALQQHTLFEGVALLKHEVNQDDAQKPVRFTVSIKWSV